MILPDEDLHRFDAPPEPRSEGRWEEPDEHIDYLETYEPIDNEP